MITGPPKSFDYNLQRIKLVTEDDFTVNEDIPIGLGQQETVDKGQFGQTEVAVSTDKLWYHSQEYLHRNCYFKIYTSSKLCKILSSLRWKKNSSLYYQNSSTTKLFHSLLITMKFIKGIVFKATCPKQCLLDRFFRIHTRSTRYNFTQKS